MVEHDVSKFVWVNLHDWSKIEGTDYDENKVVVKESDIDNFIENICNDICEKLSIPYDDLMPEIVDKNKSFYTFKEKIFNLYFSLPKDDYELVILMSSFKIPTTTNLERCFQLFQNLSEEEKIIFLSKVNTTN